MIVKLQLQLDISLKTVLCGQTMLSHDTLLLQQHHVDLPQNRRLQYQSQEVYRLYNDDREKSCLCVVDTLGAVRQYKPCRLSFLGLSDRSARAGAVSRLGAFITFYRPTWIRKEIHGRCPLCSHRTLNARKVIGICNCICDSDLLTLCTLFF